MPMRASAQEDGAGSAAAAGDPSAAAALPGWIPGSVARRIAERPLATAIVQNASWLVSERLLQMAVGFFVTAWMVRYLGPEAYGRYSYALSFAGLFGALATLGSESIVVRELARQPEADGEILGTALALRLVAGAVAWAACCIAIPFFRSDTSTRVLVFVAGSSSLFLAGGVFELWFQARIASRDIVLARSGSAIAVHAVRAAMILLAAPVAAFVALVPLQAALTLSATAALFARLRSGSAKLHYVSRRARVLARESVPMLATSAAIIVYLKIDQVMLASICGDRENGIYAPAAALSELFAFVPIALSTSAFPAIVKALDALQPAESERRLRTFYDAMAAAGYVFSVSLIAFAGPLVHLMYGDAYARTATVLQVHAGSFLFTTMGVARGRYVIARNHLHFFLGASVLGAATNVVLNVLWLPRYGAVGAAWATLVSYAVANYLSGFGWRPLWRQTLLISWSLALPLRATAHALRRVASRARRA